ncbi:hypothetical protein KIW84_064473 [Lathyrus oleraceus]|uniref:Uncharacterized protein n=1 Tax=Pisum sativum TaxID=3888 RepID=A0A9D4WCS6_PEA|nr:hypothetical protein KIW84_064473 [Pisum sativum]
MFIHNTTEITVFILSGAIELQYRVTNLRTRTRPIYRILITTRTTRTRYYKRFSLVQIFWILLLMMIERMIPIQVRVRWSNRWWIRIINMTTSLNRIFIIFVGEINLSFFAAYFSSFFVISSSSFFSSVESTKPNTNTFPRITNLRSPFSPRTLPDSSVEIFPLFFHRLFNSFINCSTKNPNETTITPSSMRKKK